MTLLILFLVLGTGTSAFLFSTDLGGARAVLTHGPVIGGVTDEAARIFVRVSLAGAAVKLGYTAGAPDLQSAMFTPLQFAGSDHDNTLQFALEHLQPNTRYYFNIWINDVPQLRSPDDLASFKTFPPANAAASFRMVYLTDFGYFASVPNPLGDGKVNTFTAAAAENPDLVFIGGDYDHRDPKLLPDKRQMFKDLYSKDPHQPLADMVRLILPHFPTAHQWDDHDYGGDNSDRTAAWRATALQVFKEYYPSYPLGKYGIWQTFRYGNQVQVLILDNRSQRDPNQAPDNANKSMLDGEHHGADGQLDWLLDELLHSTATWKLVLSSVPLNLTSDKTDSWALFSIEEHKLLDFIRAHKVGGVVFLSGDLHGGALDDGRNAGIPSAVFPSVNLPRCFTIKERKLGEWSNGVYGSANIESKTVPCPGYGVIDIARDHASIVVKDSFGQTRLSMGLTPDLSYRVP